MPTKHAIPWILTAVLLAAAAMAVGADTEGGTRNPVLEYYWKMAGETFAAHSPTATGISYTFRATSYYFTVGEGGTRQMTDSLIADHVIGADGADKATVVAGNQRRFRQLELTAPNVFRDSCHIYFFPNDTGGATLAIGFRADSTQPQQPDGLVMIDRSTYDLRRLYLYYPNKPDFKRFTRTFRFASQDGYIVVDSVCEVAARRGIFSLENYRIETVVRDIQVLAPKSGR